MKMKKSGKRYGRLPTPVPENRVAEHRQKRNLSQRELAQSAGMTFSKLNKIENQARHMTGEELLILSRVLKVPTYELLVVEGPFVPEFYDEIRMDGVIIAVLEACERNRVAKPDPKEMAELISFLYQRAVIQRLPLKDVRELADSHIKASKKNGKPEVRLLRKTA